LIHVFDFGFQDWRSVPGSGMGDSP